MKNNGIKIMSLEGAEINEYSIGIRSNYRIKEAVLSYSLLQEKLLKEGMVVNKGFTRDIINIKFGFGSQDAEGEIKRLDKTLGKLDAEKDKDKILFVKQLKEDILNNKEKYIKKSVDELREEMYKNGFSLTFKDYPQLTRNSKSYDKEKVDKLKQIKTIKDVKTRVEEYKKFYDELDKDESTIITTINYKMLFRSPAKARVGEIIFVRADLYENVHNWMCMDLKLPHEEAKIVEMSAYSSLVSSTIVDKINIPVDNILILKDLTSFYETIVKTVNVNENGECVVDDGIKIVKNTIWDGMGLIEGSLVKGKGNGMLYLRQHFFKACLFSSNIQLFFQRYYNDNYKTATIVDMFGVPHLVKDIKVITTDNAIKWLKFKELMGNTDEESYKYWCDKVKEENSDFGICKTDHPSKLSINGKIVQQMSYQHVNTLKTNKEGIESLTKASIDYVNNMKDDNKLFISFLEQNKNFSNKNSMMIDLYNHNIDIADTNLFREWKSDILTEYKAKLKKGKILTHGDNLTVCGNPYLLLQYAVGELDQYIKDGVIEGYEDSTLPTSKDYISCYTTMFENKEELAGFRNPHNAPNNIMYFKNFKDDLMKDYFNFSPNIIAVNLLKNDAQDRGNGFDEDSDFFYVTNDATVVGCAKDCYEEYPTIVNNIAQENKTYNNILEDYAKMDSRLMESKNTIGETSNLAQLALSYYWSEKDEKNKEELYDNFVILSVLAQVAIDNSKRKYDINVAKEIKRIRAMKCMKRDKPVFWKYVKKNKDKEGKKKEIKIDNSITCPMNYLVDFISDGIKNASTDKPLNILDFVVKFEGKAKKEQMDKILSIVKGYDDFVKENKATNDEEQEEWFDKLKIEDDETIDKLSKFNINDKTLNMLIVNAIKIDGKNAKYRDKLLNCLYRVNSKEFLKHFGMKKGENNTCEVL